MRVRRVLVLVPTTGALYRILSIKAMPDLPNSAVFGPDEQLLPLTNCQAEYAFLTSQGPLHLLGPPVDPGMYWLTLSGKIESGGSWHLPCLLAHVAFAHGCKLVDEPSKADLIVWATGQVNARLNIIDHNRYRVRDKVERSEFTLKEAAEVGAQIVGFLPAGEDTSPLRSLLGKVGAPAATVHGVASVFDAREIFEEALGVTAPSHGPAQNAAALRTVRTGQTPLQAYPVAVPGLSEAGIIAMLAALHDHLRKFADVLHEIVSTSGQTSAAAPPAASGTNASRAPQAGDIVRAPAAPADPGRTRQQPSEHGEAPAGALETRSEPLAADLPESASKASNGSPPGQL
jgi:hypothetical protein